MNVQDVLSQITVSKGIVTSKSTGKTYSVKEFIEQISSKLKWTQKQKRELESHFVDYIKAQSDQSKHIEEVIEKYSFQFSDGVYIVNDEVITIDEIYRLLWKEEKLLPTEVDYIIENIEKISSPIELQNDIYNKILLKIKSGKSKYLESLDILYPEINFRSILYNIITPNSKPLFHIFYDDGIGGTGKSTFLEVVTKIVGENFTSNVLLDQFGNRFIFANMLGKYVNIGDDNGRNDELQNVGTLKSIITKNRVTIDRKNISPIEVRLFAKQLFATNILPYIDFTDGGIMRRLNVVKMNKVIPNSLKLCELNDEEIGNIIGEVFNYKDLTQGNNELAITTSPLYRFYNTTSDKTYEKYKYYCEDNGFRKMNIINFEVKSKFITHFIESKKEKLIQVKIPKLVPLTSEEEANLPF